MEPTAQLPPVQEPARSHRAAWAVFVGLMMAYILAMTWRGHGRQSSEPALSGNVSGLFGDTLPALLVFAVPFAIGFVLTRPSADDLFIDRHRGLWMPWLLGAVWSVVLRLALMVPATIAVAIFILLDPANGLNRFRANRPQVENLLDPGALADPAYTLVAMTWLSFIVAGLREELWRAAVIRGICRLGSPNGPSLRWEWIGVGISSVFFGLAHLTQGWVAVVATGLLGVGLGMIQILRRSLPEAVIAHGFFDASTFFLIFVLQQKDLLKRLGVPQDVLKQLFDK